MKKLKIGDLSCTVHYFFISFSAMQTQFSYSLLFILHRYSDIVAVIGPTLKLNDDDDDDDDDDHSGRGCNIQSTGPISCRRAGPLRGASGPLAQCPCATTVKTDLLTDYRVAQKGKPLQNCSNRIKPRQ